MSRVPRKSLTGFTRLALWTAVAAVLVWAQPALGPATVPGENGLEDPSIDAIGQRMADEPQQAAEGEPGAEGAFPSFGRLVVRLVVALVLTLGVLYGGLLGLRRLLGQKGSIASPHIRVIAKSSLSPKSSVYLVEIAGQTLVIGERNGGLSLLTTVSDPKALVPAAVERADERTWLSPQRREKVAAALAGFRDQLGLHHWRLNVQSLSEKLREGTRATRSLSGRMGRRSGEPAAGEIHPSQD